MITQDRLDSISKQMEHNGYTAGQTYGYKLGTDWPHAMTSNSELSSIWWKQGGQTHTMPIYDLPIIPDGMICEPFNQLI